MIGKKSGGERGSGTVSGEVSTAGGCLVTAASLAGDISPVALNSMRS
jgi:hypothetical protein